VDLKENPYEILVGSGILKDLGAVLKPLRLGRDAFIVTNPIIRRYHGRQISAALKAHGFSVSFIEVKSGEKSKSARTAFQVISRVAALSLRKAPFIVAFGGGVVGDLAGFVAAVYKRGIPFVQVPTTLLAQADSAIGGKVAVDLPVGKNLVGAFYQPSLVVSDVNVLSTLDKRQIRNGLAEIVKYGVIADKFLFHYIEMNAAKALSLHPMIMTEIIQSCSRIKARVVAADEKETKGLRTILNFGHTVGHAIEAANQYKNYHHGEAVALGMRAAAGISCRMGMLEDADARRINAVLTALGLPEKIRGIPCAQVLKCMAFDKKFKAGENRFVLATGIGSVRVIERINPRVIRSAVNAVIGRK